jgi:hypothetical protein
MKALWPWLVLASLGAFHGINPGMGWLFAVALGLQEKSQQAVRRALLPIALGHAASIGVVVLAVGLLQAVLPESVVRYLCAVVLGVFGLMRLVRARHPRWVGMRVGFRDLTLWSFLMASAHGAGLMLVPLLLQWPAEDASHYRLMAALWPPSAMTSPARVLAAVGVHTLSLFLVTSAVALLVYEKLGVAFLRSAWLNLDVLWAAALFVAGVMALM